MVLSLLQVRLRDKVGLIPDNFVEILPASPPPPRRPSASARTNQPPPPPPQEHKPVSNCTLHMDVAHKEVFPPCLCL